MAPKKTGSKSNEAHHEDPFMKLDRERNDAIKEKDEALSRLDYETKERRQKEKEIKDLQEKIIERDVALSSLSRDREELAKLKQENERLQKAADRAKSTDATKNLREDKKRLQEELEEALSRVSSRDKEIERLKQELQEASKLIGLQPKESQPDDSRGDKGVRHQQSSVQSGLFPEMEAPSKAVIEEIRQEVLVKEEKPAEISEPKTLYENMALFAQLAQTIQMQFGQIQDTYARHDAEKAELQKQVKKFKQECSIQKEASRSLDEKINTSRKQIEQLGAQINELQKKVDDFQQENIRAAQAFEILTQQCGELRDQISDREHQTASEWAKSLATILSDLSMLVPGNEPDPDRGLSQRAAYENMLNWMEKVFNERPRQFPVKKEMKYDDQKHPWVLLDADNKGLENLLAQYDWSPEAPFSNLLEGQRCVKMRVQRMGWRVGGTVLLKARVTTLAPDGEQLGK